MISRRCPENGGSRLGGVTLTGHFTSGVSVCFQLIKRELSWRNHFRGHSGWQKEGAARENPSGKGSPCLPERFMLFLVCFNQESVKRVYLKKIEFSEQSHRSK